MEERKIEGLLSNLFWGDWRPMKARRMPCRIVKKRVIKRTRFWVK